MNHIDPSIYKNFTPLPPDLGGWHGDAPIFAKLIDLTRPSRIIEVGTWKGQSAITMGRRVKEIGLACTITCVDTWLGGLEFWLDLANNPAFDLRQKHGYPQVYYQFLSNVIHFGLEDIILPFPVASSVAAKYFATKGIQAELIYIDGSHDEADVLADLRSYYGLVKPGGVLFGDDFDWPGVQRAVSTFREEIKARLYVIDTIFWALQAPPLLTLP
jgi:predicted O-methyltransferase YrrM